MSNDARNIGGSKIDLDTAQLLIAVVNDLTDLRTKYTALLADTTAIRASAIGVNAKLDLDAGVTDTNYSALWNPAALTASAVAVQNLTK